MKKKNIIGGIGVGIVLITGIYFVRNINRTENLYLKEVKNQSIKIVDIERVVISPSSYEGFLGVRGIVIKIDESKNIFLLGCEDACIFIPVKYSGQIPKLKSKIIVYGELVKQGNGRYIFYGKEVKTK